MGHMEMQMDKSKQLPTLILVSQSPRRRQLLDALCLDYRVELPGVDERMPEAREVEEVTLENSLRKAESIAGRRPKTGVTEIIIAADTLVVLNGRVLGKPSDRNEARKMLSQLSGNTHRVVTGLTLLSEKGQRQRAVWSSVTFRKLATDEIESYLGTREPYDKAGSYAVQGLSALFIERIDGSYTNVMGLPIEALLEELPALSGIPVYDWFAP